MEFEFDQAKSAANLAKHGIDFVMAQALWGDEDRVIAGPSFSRGEPRYHLIAKFDGKLWSAFFTYREADVRIISVRRARAEEMDYYARANDHH